MGRMKPVAETDFTLELDAGEHGEVVDDKDAVKSAEAEGAREKEHQDGGKE